MKKSILKASLLVSLSFIILTGCNKENDHVAPHGCNATKQSANTFPSAAQIASMRKTADLMANTALAAKKSGANLRLVTSGDMIGFNVITVPYIGPTYATYSLYAFIQPYSAVSPSLQASYTSTFCAPTGHQRYCIVYLYNGYTHIMQGVSSFSGGGPGGCLTGSYNFSRDFGGPNTSQLYVVVFDVTLTSPSVITQVNTLWSNPRDFYYPGLSVYGNYWE